MAKIRRRKKDSGAKQTIHVNFDSRMIESLLKYIVSKSVNASELSNVRKLFERLDIEDFHMLKDKYDNIRLIKYIAEARSSAALQDTGAITSYILDKCPELEEAVETINWDPNQIGPADIRQISKSIAEKLQYSIIMSMEDEIIALYERLRNCGFYSMSEYTTRLREVLTRGLTSMQKTAISAGMVEELDFRSAEGITSLRTIVDRYHRPGDVLITGIQSLNKILSPGFQSGRLYTFLGLTGGFKSGMLLNMADQIRQCNPEILSQNNDKQKTILFITMENSINETVERLYDMYSDENARIAVDSFEKVLEVLRDVAGYDFGTIDVNESGDIEANVKSDNSKIGIQFIYKSNLSINTGDLYTMIQSQEDQGKEVICLILDYIKRINSVNDWFGDERIRLANVAQELKALAEYFQIPVITAQQVNREGNAIVDAAMRENKQDVLKFVGSANIGSSWAIAEESDWMAILNRERQKDSNELFLTVKRVKIRGKSDTRVDYFNHPFTNSKAIRLVMDYDKPFSASKRSLASSLESVEMDDPFEEDHRRPSVSEIKNPQDKSKMALKVIGVEDIGNM